MYLALVIPRRSIMGGTSRAIGFRAMAGPRTPLLQRHIRGEDMYGKSLPSNGWATAGVTTGRLLAMAGRRETRELPTGVVRQALPPWYCS